MLRQFYFAAYMQLFWESMHNSVDETLNALSRKAVKEIAYHVRHTGEWIVRLGDGTQESAQRMQDAVLALHPYTAELFNDDEHRQDCINKNICPNSVELRTQWENTINSVFGLAKLNVPEADFAQTGGRQGY